MEYMEQVYAHMRSAPMDAKKDDDNQVYWKNKIERLRQSVSLLPVNLEKAMKNYARKQQQILDFDARGGITSLERRRFNQLSKENDSLDKSQGYAQEIERHGEDIINNNATLKKVRTRTIQMLNTIGMSESVLKMIEKRSKMDLVIFAGLALLTLVLIYFLMYFIKPLFSFGSGSSSGEV